MLITHLLKEKLETKTKKKQQIPKSSQKNPKIELKMVLGKTVRPAQKRPRLVPKKTGLKKDWTEKRLPRDRMRPDCSETDYKKTGVFRDRPKTGPIPQMCRSCWNAR